MTKKLMLILAGIGLVIISLYNAVTGFYGKMVQLDEQLLTQESQVNNMYDRRADLIPQLSSVVKKAAEFEKGTQTEIAGLRAQSANLSKLESLAGEGKIKTEEYAALLATTMSGLRIITENYPTLQAVSQFKDLLVQIEGSENRIRTEIWSFNETVGTYNIQVRSFPIGFFLSGIMGFDQKDRINPPAGKDFKAVPDVDKLLDSTPAPAPAASPMVTPAPAPAQ